MSRRRKLSRQPPPKTLYPELGDWRGFRARRRNPRLALLAFVACAAVAGTVVMAIGGHSARGFNQVWLLTLVALQLVIVAECRLVFRSALRHALPLASALAVPLFVALALDAPPLTTIGLALAFVAMAFVPQRWLDRLLE
jgi:hypothetical protein